MDVDEAGVASPTNEWMEAAQRAADTDGILENGPAKRQKVCTAENKMLLLAIRYSNSFLKRRHEPLGAAGAPTLPVRETSTPSVCSARLTG